MGLWGITTPPVHGPSRRVGEAPHLYSNAAQPQMGMKMKIDAKKTVQVEAKTFSLYVKVCDRCGGELKDQDGQTIHDAEGDGYVPNFFPGEHYGDYLILDIDIDTGQITNWTPPTADQLHEWMDRTD